MSTDENQKVDSYTPGDELKALRQVVKHDEKMLTITMSEKDQEKIIEQLKFMRGILAKDADQKEMTRLIMVLFTKAEPFKPKKGWMKKWKT